MNFPLFIAKRIYSDNGDKRKVSRPAIIIATAGVAIGLAVMIISISVVLGFKHTIRDKVIGFGSQIQVANFMSLQSTEPYPVCVNDSMVSLLKGIPGVKHVQVFAMKQGILKTDSDFLGVVFKGVGQDFDSTFIHRNMVRGSIPRFSSTSSNNKILISETMSNKLLLGVGDKVFAYFIDHNGVRARRFTIFGIYQTNLSQYDNVMCYTDLQTVVKLNGWESDQASGAEITVKDFNKLDSVAKVIVSDVNRTIDKYGETYTSQTIYELNPQIFHWLSLLDLNVWIILGLMFAVAGITVISGLLIIILERTTMIGLLKALGARDKTVRHTFLWFAAFIIGRGLLIGDIIGIGLITLQRLTGFATLDPTTYYVNTVPVEFDYVIFILLNVATLLVSMFVLIAPSYLISHIHPAKAMHYE